MLKSHLIGIKIISGLVFGAGEIGRRIKRGGENVNNIGSYTRLLGMFFIQFTLMNISFCAWQQHSDAFREHSSVFRDTFTVLNYPRPTYPSAWRALSPSLLLAVTLPCSQRVCTNWLLSAFPRFWYVSFSSNSSLGKTEGYQGKTTDASFLSIALISLTMSN